MSNIHDVLRRLYGYSENKPLLETEATLMWEVISKFFDATHQAVLTNQTNILIEFAKSRFPGEFCLCFEGKRKLHSSRRYCHNCCHVTLEELGIENTR